jgi:prophage maintenance system killer protein
MWTGRSAPRNCTAGPLPGTGGRKWRTTRTPTRLRESCSTSSGWARLRSWRPLNGRSPTRRSSCSGSHLFILATTCRTCARSTGGSSATSTAGRGQIRTVGIAKGSLFCLPQHIETSAAEISRALRSENCLRDLDREAFVARLAYYLGEVNAVHPFREGNGRTQRAFFEQFARDAGYTLAWQHLDAARNLGASAAIMRGDAEPMRKMLDTLVSDGI